MRDTEVTDVVVLHENPLRTSFPLCVSLQVLIELESALLDDQPHWYKLQLHDVSSLPLPSASPYLQRRGLQPEHSQPSRRLQSENTPNVFHFLFLFTILFCFEFFCLSVDFLFYFPPMMLCQTKVLTITQVTTTVCMHLCFSC